MCRCSLSRTKRAADAVAAVIEEHKQEWAAGATERADKLRADYLAAIEALSSSRLAYIRERLVATWFAEFPHRPPFKEPAGGGVRGLRVERRHVLGMEELTRALREELEPLERPMLRDKNGEPLGPPKSLQVMHGHAA